MYLFIYLCNHYRNYHQLTHWSK
uniref:Uncharacterized protein n=1 Tax=Anguilla anguilla TaxID=7936 RepID=A0A0E9R8L1_ANGAN